MSLKSSSSLRASSINSAEWCNGLKSFLLHPQSSFRRVWKSRQQNQHTSSELRNFSISTKSDGHETGPNRGKSLMKPHKQLNSFKYWKKKSERHCKRYPQTVWFISTHKKKEQKKYLNWVWTPRPARIKQRQRHPCWQPTGSEDFTPARKVGKYRPERSPKGCAILFPIYDRLWRKKEKKFFILLIHSAERGNSLK
jgi:hypothetical protein